MFYRYPHVVICNPKVKNTIAKEIEKSPFPDFCRERSELRSKYTNMLKEIKKVFFNLSFR
jgi:hypothetical protein